MLEEMAAFFDARLEGYDEHMLSNIQSARAFYPFTAGQLPKEAGCCVLDLGCGTGLELEEYFRLNPLARVTGIDLAPGMLAKLQEKFPDKALTLVQGSYFVVPFGDCVFDAAVSVESLHHFTIEQKIPLYRKLKQAMKPGGYFILTDYFADTQEQENFCRRELMRLMEAQGIGNDAFYHFDTPLTVAHETEALLTAGFSSVEMLGQWGATSTLKAK